MAILIIFCFVFLLYGLYSKISNTQVLSVNEINTYSLNLNKSEDIQDIKVIDENNILLVTSYNDQTYLIIYNFNQNKAVSRIGK